MSFNSSNFGYWESQTTKVSELFEYKDCSYCLGNPLRIGFSLGVNLKKNQSIEAGFHFDGVSNKSRIGLATYQPLVDVYTPNFVTFKSRSIQNRFFLNYKYSILDIPMRTNLSIFPSLGIAVRRGAKGIESLGSFGFSGALLKDSLNFYTVSTGYTAFQNWALQYGFGLSSDVFVKKKYLFSLSIQYTHSKSYLSSDELEMGIVDIHSNKTTKYYFTAYQRASGVYFGISRKLQLIPWKRAHNKT